MFDVIRHIFIIPLQNQRHSKGENGAAVFLRFSDMNSAHSYLSSQYSGLTFNLSPMSINENMKTQTSNHNHPQHLDLPVSVADRSPPMNSGQSVTLPVSVADRSPPMNSGQSVDACLKQSNCADMLNSSSCTIDDKTLPVDPHAKKIISSIHSPDLLFDNHAKETSVNTDNTFYEVYTTIDDQVENIVHEHAYASNPYSNQRNIRHIHTMPFSSKCNNYCPVEQAQLIPVASIQLWTMLVILLKLHSMYHLKGH